MASFDKQRARDEAQRLLSRFSVSSPPVPVDKIAKWLGATLQYAPLDQELSGMAYIKDGQPIIGVNSLHHPHRQRFTIAHEIAHLVLHRDYISANVHVDKAFKLLRDPVAATGTDALEIEANAFAAELLMPMDWLKEAMALEGELDDEASILAVSRKFKVSKSAIQNRLMNMF